MVAVVSATDASAAVEIGVSPGSITQTSSAIANPVRNMKDKPLCRQQRQ